MYEIQKNEKIESSLHYIKKNGIIFKYFTELFKDIESYTPKNEIFAFICIFFYFAQMMSYMIEPYLISLDNNSTIFLFYILYYSNFVNLFKWNSAMRILIFIFASTLNIFIFAYFIITPVILFLGNGKKLKNLLNSIISRICFFYYWIFLMPALDVFINLFDCQGLYSKESCFQNDYLLFVFGLINFVLTIFFGFLFSYLNSEYSFLDLKKLKFTFNINFELANLMRIAIVVFKRIESNVFWLNASAYLLFSFFLFVFYFQTYPFPNSKLRIFFLGNLLSILLLVAVMILWQVNILKEIDILYINLTFTILSFKLSTKFDEIIRNAKFMIHNGVFYLFSVQEIYQIQNFERYSNIAFLLGFFKSHFRDCCISDCKMLQEEKRLAILEKFISVHLQNEIGKAKRKTRSNNNFQIEFLILKYLSFLVDYEQNFVKAHYEVQNNIDKKEKFSLFFQIVLFSLKDKIKNKIKFRIKSSSLSNTSSNSEKDESFYNFFKAFKLKKEMELEIMQLLKLKTSFLDSYVKDNNHLSELIAKSSKLVPKIQKFKEKLKLLKSQKAPFYKIIAIKFEAILHCLLFNKLWEGFKLEQEILANIDNNSGPNSLYNTIFNFLHKNFIVIEVQFSNCDGSLKDFSLSEKFRSFFGYKRGVKLPKNLLNYMPSFIATIHPLFLQNFLENRNSNCSNKELCIHSYGKDSDGFVFPICLRLGFNLDWHNQFVMYAAITKPKNANEKIFICNFKGEIHNISQSAFEELKKEYEFIDKDDIKKLNVFFFIPKLIEIINQIKTKDKKNINDQNSLSLFSVMHFPQNIDKILKLSKRRKINKEEIESSNQSFQSRIDLMTMKTLYKQKFDNFAINDDTSYLKTKSEITREFLLNEDSPPKTANICFNLSFFKHEYINKEKLKRTLEFISVHIYEFKKNEAPICLKNEDTAQINESSQKDELKIPIEDVKFVKLFSREQHTEVLFLDKPIEREELKEEKIHVMDQIPKFFNQTELENNDIGSYFFLFFL